MSDDGLNLQMGLEAHDEASPAIRQVQASLAELTKQVTAFSEAFKKSFGDSLARSITSAQTASTKFTTEFTEGAAKISAALKGDASEVERLTSALKSAATAQKEITSGARATSASIQASTRAASTASTRATTAQVRQTRDRISDVNRVWRVRERSEQAELRHLRTVSRERAVMRRDAMRSGGHAFNHARHAARSLNHPVHESLGFALQAGAVAGGAFAEHVVRASEAFDTSMSRLKMFAPQLDADAIRRQALSQSIDLGIGADRIVDSIAKSVRDGVPPAIAESLPKSIVQTAQVMGGDVERLTDSLAEGIQEATSMGWIKNKLDARRFLNLEAGLSTTAGNTSEKTEQFVAAGGLGHGKEMGLDLEKTMAYGAMLNASGSRTGQASARFMGQLSQNVPKMFDKYVAASRSHVNSEENRAVRSAPRNLGYANVREMQEKIMAGPEGLIDFSVRLQKLNDKQRKLVLEGYGFSEQGGAMLAELGSNDGAKGKSILARAKDLAEQKEANDYLSEKFAEWSKSLAFMVQQVEQGWRAIENEIGSVIKDDIIAPFRDWWVMLSEGIVNSDLKDRVHRAIMGFVHGLGFDDVRQLLDTMTGHVHGFDFAGFAKGVGEGIRAIVDDMRSLGSVFGGAGGISAETVGRVATELLGFSVALRVVAPIVSTIGGIASAFLAVKAALEGVALVSKLTGLADGIKAIVGIETATVATGLISVAGGLTAIAAGVEALMAAGVLQHFTMPWANTDHPVEKFFWGTKPDGSSARPGWAGGPSTDRSDASPSMTKGAPNPTAETPDAYWKRKRAGLHPSSFDGGDGQSWRDLLTPASYSPSDSGDVVRDATVSTERGVFEIRDGIDRLGTVLKASLETGVGPGSGGGGGGGGGGGPANMRYGRINSGEYRGTPSKGGQGGPTVGGGAGGSRSWRNNNPGNIEYGPYAKSMGAIGTDGRFAVFPDYASGRKAQSHLLFESGAYKDLTLRQAIGKWAPASENNVPAYLSAMGGDPNAKMGSFSEAQRGKLLDAMQAHEGWKVGTRQNTQVQKLSESFVGGDNSGTSGAVDKALGMADKGVGAGQAANALGHAMTAGLWCADFVNGVLGKSGIKGSGSSLAASFSNWGTHVNTNDVKKGDVIEENSGAGTRIHHAGMATGKVQRDANGNVTAMQMVSGNYGRQVKTNWEKVGIIADLRRSNQQIVETADKLKAKITSDQKALSAPDVARQIHKSKQPDAVTNSMTSADNSTAHTYHININHPDGTHIANTLAAKLNSMHRYGDGIKSVG